MTEPRAKNARRAPNAPEAPAVDAVEAAPAAAEAAPAAAEAAPAAAPADLKARLRDLEKTAREAAKKRIAGTRAEKALEEIPARVERELGARIDQFLDKVGLVRKSRVPATPTAGDKTEAVPTSQAA